MRRVSLLLCALSAVAVTGVARADDPETLAAPAAEPVPPPDAPGIVDARLASLDDGIGDRFAAWASERFFGGAIPGGDMVLLLTEVGVRFGLSPDSRIRVDWGVAFSSSHVTGTISSGGMDMPYDMRVDRVEARNAVFALEWAPRIDSTRFSIGLGTALPVAGGLNTPGTSEEAANWTASRYTHERMLASAGGLDPWRYRSERFALFLPVELLFPIESMTISLAGAGGISIPVIGAGAGTSITGDVQATAQIAGDVVPELRMGLRVAISVLDIGANAASGDTTEVQPSVTGWARIQLAPAFVVVSVLADLGGPYGLGRANGVYGVTVGAGASL